MIIRVCKAQRMIDAIGLRRCTRRPPDPRSQDGNRTRLRCRGKICWLLRCRREGAARRTSVHECLPRALSMICLLVSYSFTCLRAEWLQLQVGGVGRHRENAQRVRVAETALPALDGDDSRASFDDVEFECTAQTKADTVVDLADNVSDL